MIFWRWLLLILPTLKVNGVTINGNWSPWTKLETDCVKLNETSGEVINDKVECGGGVKIRTRSCTNPRPQGTNAKNCPGKSVQTVPCNDHPCDMRWSQWSPCSAKCGRGLQTAWTECQANAGDAWVNCSSLVDHKEAYSFEWVRDCNTWNKSHCPSLCDEGYSCPDFAKCIDISTWTDPKVKCECQMGRVVLAETGQCIEPLPAAPTPRPIPVLPEAVKSATTAVTKSASTLLVIFVGCTLCLFAFFRIYDSARVIQMNMEIALICAHLCLIVPDMTAQVEVCRIISILTHFFFLACFMFMFLEALHVYAMVASVVHKDGMFTKLQNIVLGWGISSGFLLISIAINYQLYGGQYHCWLQINSNLFYWQYLPNILLTILILTLIEAAGNAANNYKNLPDTLTKVDEAQLTSAKIMQRTSALFILPLLLASFICGTFSEYDQNAYLYGIFTILNALLGAMILFFHSSANHNVRGFLAKLWRQIITKN